MNLRILFGILLLALLSLAFYFYWTQQLAVEAIPSAPEVAERFSEYVMRRALTTSNYRPKMDGYLPDTLIEEETDIFYGFVGPDNLARGAKKATLLAFFNELRKSPQNKRVKGFGHLIAYDYRIKLVSKRPKQNDVTIYVYYGENFIETSDNETIFLEPSLMKILRGL